MPIIFFAGLALALALVPDLASLWTPYGVLLLSKIGGFGVLMGHAALNKWRLGGSRGEGAALAVFGRAVRVEWG